MKSVIDASLWVSEIQAHFAELLSAPDSVGAKAVVQAERGRVARVPVTDRAVVENLNTPDAYRALLDRTDELTP